SFPQWNYVTVNQGYPCYMSDPWRKAVRHGKVIFQTIRPRFPGTRGDNEKYREHVSIHSSPNDCSGDGTNCTPVIQFRNECGPAHCQGGGEDCSCGEIQKPSGSC